MDFVRTCSGLIFRRVRCFKLDDANLYVCSFRTQPIKSSRIRFLENEIDKNNWSLIVSPRNRCKLMVLYVGLECLWLRQQLSRSAEVFLVRRHMLLTERR
eukprot:Gregarina_sp_Poly_1__4585@NODE_2458_length_2112_cov_410_754034_g1556_i0_p4_GENE_NODE_2458_length_2112_cov_410_754034_g1556_i0NODE_2458_length_2112_cov_410_754034_g1556_i0_p4_ORF_typecomplete_len100_score5_15_NODE_2458_length_2112_cov_410_754034_g1556_i014641763